MKVKPEHYNYMKAEIAKLLPTIEEHRRAAATAPDPEKRLRWGLSIAAGLSMWICNNLYPYCNDDHIDTALKRIMKDLEI